MYVVVLVRRGQARGGYGWTPDKYECTVCHRTGFGGDSGPGSWADSCLRGHAPCPWCGAILTVKKDGTPRVHTRCTKRPSLLPTPGGIS
jgi:hypothetical protein